MDSPAQGTARTKKFVFVEEHEPAFLPIWREVFTGIEWLKLRACPVYYGLGIPRGDASAVITVPGFLGSDLYLMEMNLWLERIGYRAYASAIGRNAECPDLLIDRLLGTIRRAQNETGRPVHLIGHSLGGVISRAAGAISPELVASITTLGSPFRGVRSHPSVLFSSRRVKDKIHRRAHKRPAHKPLRQSCFTGSCNCGFAEAVKAGLPESVHQTAIFTRTDGIVDWSVCITGEPEFDVEVKGTHCGLAWNAEVYRVVGQRLHESTSTVRPRNGRSTPVLGAGSVV